MALPPKHHLDAIRSLRGQPKVTHPHGGTAYPRIEFVYTIPKSGLAAVATTVSGYAGSTRVALDTISENSTHLEIYARYDTLPGPAITTKRYDAEADIFISTARTEDLLANITEGIVQNGSSVTITEKEPIDSVRGLKIVTNIPIGDYTDLASAKVETHMGPYQYPGRLDIDALFSYLGPLGHRRPSTQTAEITTKTYWVISTTKPVLVYDEMTPSSPWVLNQQWHDVLHDSETLTYNGVPVTLAATTPSYTTFTTSWIGTSRVIGGSVTNAGHKYRWKVTARSVVMK